MTKHFSDMTDEELMQIARDCNEATLSECHSSNDFRKLIGAVHKLIGAVHELKKRGYEGSTAQSGLLFRKKQARRDNQ